MMMLGIKMDSTKHRPHKESFAGRLRSLLQERDMNASDLAKEFYVSKTTISGWLKGAIPRPDARRKLADFFGKSEEWFFTGIEPHSEEEAKAMASVARGVRKAMRDAGLEFSDEEFERLLHLTYAAVQARRHDEDVSKAAERYAKEILSLLPSN